MKHQNTPTNTQMIESVIDVFAEELKEIRDSAREDYYYETHGMSDDIDMAYVKATEAIESLISEAVNKARIEEMKMMRDLIHLFKVNPIEQMQGKTSFNEYIKKRLGELETPNQEEEME